MSLITGMEYRMEWWNGIWNGQWMYKEQLNHVTDALLSLGWAIPTTAWGLTSLQRFYEQVVADMFSITALYDILDSKDKLSNLPLQNYLVKVTSQSGYSSFRVNWTSEYIYYEENFKHCNHHHPLTIQSSFIKKQRASTDTCLLANGHSYHFLWFTCWLYYPVP